MKITLPSDAWAQLRDKTEVPVAKRTRALKALIAMQEAVDPLLDPVTGQQSKNDKGQLLWKSTAATAELTEALEVALVLAFVTQWSFDFSVTEENIREQLTGVALDAIVQAGPYRDIASMMPDFTTDGALDPKAPTGS